MGKIRKLLLLALAVGALPVAAHAQDGGYLITEHDWRLTIGATSYGLSQTAWGKAGRVSGPRTTTIYLGHYTANTRIPAPHVAVMFLLPVGVVVFVLLPGLWLRKRVP
jgi:hypothetical protein